MIIVSQDKETIVNFDNVLKIYIEIIERNIWITARQKDRDVILAEYKTKERAKEVLQEIVENYRKNIIHGSSSCFGSTKVVYEMPED